MGEPSDMLQLPDKYVKVGQVSTRFWQMGDEGSTVILVHGIGGSVENWAANIEELSQHHRVFALDLLGFGRTDKPAVSYSVANLARFLSDFLAAQGIERASVIGHSLGGGVSLEFAHSLPREAAEARARGERRPGPRMRAFLFGSAPCLLSARSCPGPAEKGARGSLEVASTTPR